MQTRSRNTFTSIHTEGSLLPVDLLQRVLRGDKDLGGLSPVDYHLPENEKLNEAINRSWNRLQGAWAAFETSRSRLSKGDPGTTLTRERWLLPLFQELGYGRLVSTKAITIEGKDYPISHGWGNVPIHLVGCGVDIDKRAAGVAGASKASPHSLVQELLNQADDRQWGIVSNGLRLRILRDNVSLTRQAFLEFDLEAMFSGEVYADFVVLWLFCHQSRFEPITSSPAGGGRQEGGECWLEKWSKVAHEQGTRALDQLRNGVQEAISILGSGFLAHPANQNLRQKLRQGDLNTQDYYRQLLRLVYRLIFLFAAEDRDLLLDPQADAVSRHRYIHYYSTARLRRLAERQRGGRHSDLWQGLKLVMDILGGKNTASSAVQTANSDALTAHHSPLALPVLNGFLFSEQALPDLEMSQVDNQSLLNAIRSLAFTLEGNSRRAVDYKNLGPEELGSVYESLLELHPILNSDAGRFELTSASGHERKTTGSYYTPTSLIQVLLDSALNPVIEQALDIRETKIDESKGETRISILESRLLDLKICDPACGSGHFLIAAAHRIARKLAGIRTGDEEPSPQALRHALRDVIRHCIYGVDINPMAVELCKVNLWLESLEPGKPLSFLDAHIKFGNSLIGVGPKMDLNELEVPDEAFTPVTGDHKATAALLKKRNKQEHAGQESLFVTVLKTREDLDRWLAEHQRKMEAMPEDSAEQVQAKENAYLRVSQSAEYRRQRQIADLWTAAFFWKIKKFQDATYEISAPTQGQLRRLREGQAVQPGLLEEVEALSRTVKFFHWPLEFADVAAVGGFDCVLGNPPWEMLQLEEQEFFASRDPEIAELPGEQRKRAIAKLHEINLPLARLFEDTKHNADAQNKFFRKSHRFPLTATGKMNSYALFAENFRGLMSARGRAGVIVPTGIATDDTTKDFFGDLVEKRSLASLFDFENREKLFPAVDSRMKFCLLTLSGTPVKQAQFVFFATCVEHLRDERRRFTLDPAEIALFNPNTRTMPVFRTRADAELTRAIYQRVPVLVNERTGENPWGVSFKQGLFNMTSDSGLFITEPREGYVRLYEAKMFWHYDHRWATFDGNDFRELSSEEKNDAGFLTTPRYWVPKSAVDTKKNTWQKKWYLGYRRISNTTNERTFIMSVIPEGGCGDNIFIILTSQELLSPLISTIVGCSNSIMFDYVARQKMGGVNLNFFYTRQFPLFYPNRYSLADINFVTDRILELVYTAYDMKPFAVDMGYHGEPFRWDEERRAVLRAELDAYYARLYGMNRKQLRYILDPADLTPGELEDILDPWEEVSDALDPSGYDARRTASDFPGETFRVLKEKEFKQFGEYRTRRLVLEAWERLKGMEIGNPEGYRTQEKQETPQREVITLNSPKEESKPMLAQKPSDEQPTLTDFGLYKCEVCGKMVMGYEREDHAQQMHKNLNIEWKKIR